MNHPTAHRVALALLLLATLAAWGCSSAATHDATPDLYFKNVAQLREAHLGVQGEPATLAEAVRAPRSGDPEWSELTLTGTVVDVRGSHGVRYPHADPLYDRDEQAGAIITAYDDPEAHERAVLVTIRTDWASDQRAADDATLTIGLGPDVDPYKMLRSLEALDEVAAVTAVRHGGRSDGELYPILNGALLGEVSAGTLSFPGLGDQEESFLAGVDTISELREAVGRS